MSNVAPKEKCIWLGFSGREYTHHVYHLRDIEKILHEGYSIYVLVRQSGFHGWDPLYVGRTESPYTRLTLSHERISRAVKMGATHIHICCDTVTPYEISMIEKDLIRQLNPRLNVQQKVLLEQ